MGYVTDPRERRLREALAQDQGAGQAEFLVTACYAAGLCQWDLGCPFMDSCHSNLWGQDG
jgi:hypothetical protein